MFTASCHRPAPVLIHGYFCFGLRGTGLSTDNCSRSRSEREFDFCIMEDTVITRTEAFGGCLNRNGILGLPEGHILNHNTRYWSGRQRTSKVSETYNEGESLCLSVVRVGSRLYTEPDSCTAQKTFLCKGSLESDTMTTSMSRTELTNQTYTTRRTEILQSSRESSSTGIYLIRRFFRCCSYLCNNGNDSTATYEEDAERCKIHHVYFTIRGSLRGFTDSGNNSVLHDCNLNKTRSHRTFF